MVISAPSARQVNKWHCYHPGLGHLGQVYQVYRVYHLAGWFCGFETNENIRVGTLKRLALLSQASSKFTNQICKSIKRSRDIMEVHSVNRMQDGKNSVVSVGNNLAKPNSLLRSIVHIVENSRFWSICSSSLRINIPSFGQKEASAVALRVSSFELWFTKGLKESLKGKSPVGYMFCGQMRALHALVHPSPRI